VGRQNLRPADTAAAAALHNEHPLVEDAAITTTAEEHYADKPSLQHNVKDSHKTSTCTG
jgi:hypothetical protein